MNLLIKSARITDPNSTFNQQIADILIENGVITQIAQSIQSNFEVFDATNKIVTPGFFDLNCNIGELGLETKEDIQSGSKAAAAGGFTGLALMPNTQPPVHSKSEVEFIFNKSRGNLVDIFPLGTISHKCEGKDMAEMYDMHQSGAKAFTDGKYPVQDAGLMERAMLYAQGFEGLVFSYPEDKAIAGKAKVHEGEISTLLGMKGIPALAEELMIARDLYLAEYTGSKIHFSTLSTRRSVDLVRQAKAKGLKVTCDVAAHHLVLTHADLLGFDSQYKVKPPLRTDDDVAALITGLNDGTIDAIVSQHTPHEIEFKDVEFEVAEFGMIGLQTALSLTLQSGLSVDTLVQKLAVGPRRILNLNVPFIAEGQQANLVVFDAKQEWTYTKQNNQSKSYNSPFIDKQLTGKVLLTCNNNQVFKS
ncbi:dihydroorotase [Mucilaginibacter gracilis]|uniref:Dihydroorotase n=1 Tax=Mucilaginibacter gracilis TaxID=423350 RepID=A0A495J7V3_9SPHI|nr:dihydroorotase [Mucilaginibacter gracilis]RKR84434.1 dihydroorotase [Mucilaginibacter gracilis]